MRAKAASARRGRRPLTEEELARAQELGRTLEVAWNAVTTTVRDRKLLLRALIDEVQLRTEEKRHLVRIVWKAPWRIVLSEEVRRRLAGGAAPAGWVGLTEAARRLGLSKPLVAYMVNEGKLSAVRTTVGKRECWRIDVSSSDCGVQRQLFDQMCSVTKKES